MSERQFAVCRDWALGADSLQWIIYKRASKLKGGWYGVSFVSSRRTILERCMREKGCPELNRTVLLAGLPETFNEWNRRAKKLPTGTATTVMGPYSQDNPLTRDTPIFNSTRLIGMRITLG